MVLMLEEDQFFSMDAYVTAAGYQTVALSGYLVRRRGENVYVQRLLPEHFNGWNRSQLVGSWRQDIGATGHQTILSRSGGQPMPTSGVYWTKISGNGYNHHQQQERQQPAEQKVTVEIQPSWTAVAAVGLGLMFIIGYVIAKK